MNDYRRQGELLSQGVLCVKRKKKRGDYASAREYENEGGRKGGLWGGGGFEEERQCKDRRGHDLPRKGDMKKQKFRKSYAKKHG